MLFSCKILFALLCAVPVTADVADDAKNRPVSKVINILRDMVTQLEKEEEEDEEIYEKMGCWCTTGDKEKTQAISDAEEKIVQLQATIEDATANSARLNTELAALEKETAKNTDTLGAAAEQRAKNLADFNAEEKEHLLTIESLRGAVQALAKHHRSSFLQNEATSTSAQMEYLKAIASVQGVLSNRYVGDELTDSQRRALDFFVKTGGQMVPEEDKEKSSTGYSLSQDTQRLPTTQVESQTGEIFGMLKGMKEGFEQRLADAQADEAKSLSDYEKLKAAKEDEVDAGAASIESKTKELAKTDENNARAKEELDDTRESLAADKEFLASLKETCKNVDQEFEERTKTRQLEIQAVSKALAFLNSDEAHELFTRTFNPALLQTQSKVESKHREKVSRMLRDAAAKFEDPRLSALSVRARLDAFVKVKAAIQELVGKLEQQTKDEIKKRDYCIESLNTNERDTEMKERDRDDLKAEVDTLTTTIDTLEKSIEMLKAEVADAQVQMKRAGEDREKETAQFQQTVADQRATQKLLKAALGILKGFYEKAALVQIKQHASKQPAPPGFKSYENNASSGGVMGMMQTIIDESKELEAEAVRGQDNAQADYETFVKETNAAIEAKSKEIVGKADAKAKAEEDKVQAMTEMEATLGEIESLMNENADLHKDCDFTLKNFEPRQAARNAEADALRKTLAILSGASFSAFLQK